MKKEILLVEYATATIDAVKEVLSHPIFQLTVADEGEKAKNLFKERNFDLMITAAMLPKFHGFSLSQYVAETYPNTRIVIISGIYKGFEYKHKAVTQYRADDFFEKPLDKHRFKKRVFELLNIDEGYLKAGAELPNSRVSRVDTAKIPTLKKIQEQEKMLSSQDLFGDLVDSSEDTPAYEIELGDEPDRSLGVAGTPADGLKMFSETIEFKQPNRRLTDNQTTQKINLDLDRLAKTESRAKDDKKFKKIEDDISKKFEDTLSGLGIGTAQTASPVKEASEPGLLPTPETQQMRIPPEIEKKIQAKRASKQEELGDYEILDLIARGGMAEIYKAKKKGVKGFEKLIALKKILSGYVEDDKYIEMFVDEAKIAAELTHPNIVQIYDLGQKDDFYFIAMEYVQGKDLRLMLRKLAESGQVFPEELVLYLVRNILAALNYAHSARDSSGKKLDIVHRDVSPHNIMISYTGDVKLTDFGVSKAKTKLHHTLSGALKGKLLYMSPEQANAEEDIDHRSDLYSVGIILFESITGKKLFMDSSEMVILKKVQEGRIVKPSEIKRDIDPELEAIILKALQKDRRSRYQNASEMINAIETYLRKHYDRDIHALHLAHFIVGLFKEEMAKEDIKPDLKPLPYQVKQVPGDSTEPIRITSKDPIAGVETAKIRRPGVPETEVIKVPEESWPVKDDFVPIIEIDLDKDKDEEFLKPNIPLFSGFSGLETEDEARKKKKRVFLIVFLVIALVLTVVSVLVFGQAEEGAIGTNGVFSPASRYRVERPAGPGEFKTAGEPSSTSRSKKNG